MDIGIFTAAMRTEFARSMQAVAEPAPVDNIVTVVPSTARIENYAWMTPAPGIAQYLGHRRKLQMGGIRYSVENLEYDGTLTVSLRDVEDDQVGGYKMRMKDLAEKAKKPFMSRLIMQTVGAGKVNTHFDGTAFFATSHTYGGAGAAPTGFTGGGNLLAFDPAATDAVTHRFVLCVHSGVLKPFLYQNRKAPKFNTDAGTPQALKAKQADYWIDLEAAGAYGYWWDAIMVELSDTPTLTELFTCTDGARRQMRTFTLPRALASDPPEYVHEQTVFSPANSTIICSPGLEQLFRHLLNEERIGVSVAGSTSGLTNNIYYNLANLITTNWLETANMPS